MSAQVVADAPILPATDSIAAHCDSCCGVASVTSRTALARCSGENLSWHDSTSSRIGVPTRPRTVHASDVMHPPNRGSKGWKHGTSARYTRRTSEACSQVAVNP